MTTTTPQLQRHNNNRRRCGRRRLPSGRRRTTRTRTSSPRVLFVGVVVALIIIVALVAVVDAGSPSWISRLPVSMYRRTRRFLNLSSLFGQATTSPTPYDRIAGQPVYSVTTPWGSPYMTMEKLSDLDEVVPDDTFSSTNGQPQSLSEENNEYRPVALYFLDPDDALALHGEMKQMEQMEGADLRLTCFSLAKALRQASNLGKGLLTGVPPDPNDGKFKNDENGNVALRYKLVPPKRQLYYAARCVGRERVGLFGDSAAEEAQAAVIGNSALEGRNLVRRRDKRERKTPASSSKKTPMQLANAHVEGYCGVPVFYAPSLRRRLPLLKRLLTGTRFELPMFFNYEDLEQAYFKTQKKFENAPALPDEVEVFNLWDVLTSMDRDANKKKSERTVFDAVAAPLERRFSSSPQVADLEHITFVPSSRSVHYKEAVSARGNGKARLRPMR